MWRVWMMVGWHLVTSGFFFGVFCFSLGSIIHWAPVTPRIIINRAA
jgi:hypothetical protein